MANISCTFSNVTTQEERAAQFAIDQYNASNPDATVANANELVEAIILQDYLPHWIRDETASVLNTENAVARFRISTDAERTAALAELAELPE